MVGKNNKAAFYLMWRLEYLSRQLFRAAGEYAPEILDNLNRVMQECVLAGKGKYDSLVEFIDAGDWRTPPCDALARLRIFRVHDIDCVISRIDTFLKRNGEVLKLYPSCALWPTPRKTLCEYAENGTLLNLIGPIRGEVEIAYTGGRKSVVLQNARSEDQWGNISPLHQVSDDGMMSLDGYAIDVFAPMDDIFAEISLLVCRARKELIIVSQDGKERTPLDLSGGCDGIGPCAGGRCEMIDNAPLRQITIDKMDENGVTFATKSNNARAVGLWLWDFIEEHRCSGGEAIRALKKEPFLIPLMFSESPERTFQLYLEKTRACIEAGEVLPMSNQ